MTADRVLARLAPRPLAAAGRLLSWGLWLLMLTLVLGSVLVWLVDGQEPLPISFARGPIGVASVTLCAFVYTTLGAVLGSRLPGNPIGWLLLAIGMLFAFLTPVNLMIQHAFEVARAFPAATLFVAWGMSSAMTPVIVGSSLTICLVFPDGRFLPGRWWWGAVLAFIGAVLLAIASALEPTGLIWYPAVPNPAALPGGYRTMVSLIRLASLAMLIGAAAVGAAAVVTRYRRCDATVQAQLYWILAGIATMTTGLVPILVARYALQVSDATGEILIGVGAVAFCAFPVSVALAIVRRHLFELDQVVSGTLVYVPLMGILAGVYTASVTLLQRIFVSLTNNTSDAAVVLSVLVLASVFAPIRSALEARVGRILRPAARDRGRMDLGEPIPAVRRDGRPGGTPTEQPAAAVSTIAAPSGERTAAAPAAAGPRVVAAGPSPDANIAARIAALEASLEELRRREAATPRQEPDDS
jgi:hypothetical protein